MQFDAVARQERALKSFGLSSCHGLWQFDPDSDHLTTQSPNSTLFLASATGAEQLKRRVSHPSAL